MSVESTSVPPRSQFGMRGIDRSDADKKARPWQSKRKRSAVKDPAETKRTAAMTLVAIGAGAFGVWAFASTGNGKDAHGKVYASPQDCARDGALSAVHCDHLWNASLKLHAARAPSFATLQKCEEEHGAGRCTQPSDGDPARRNLYIPRMTGYVMGRLASGSYQAAPLFKMKSDGPMQHRMTATPEPAQDQQGRRISAFVWMSHTRTAAASAAKPVGRSLFASKTGASKPGAARGGFGGGARAASASG